MSAVKNAVVQRFKSLCSERGIAANELANISGMTPSTVYSPLMKKEKTSLLQRLKSCVTVWKFLSESFSAQRNLRSWSRK